MKISPVVNYHKIHKKFTDLCCTSAKGTPKGFSGIHFKNITMHVASPIYQQKGPHIK